MRAEIENALIDYLKNTKKFRVKKEQTAWMLTVTSYSKFNVFILYIHYNYIRVLPMSNNHGVNNVERFYDYLDPHLFENIVEQLEQ